jgi:hypothetical protein
MADKFKMDGISSNTNEYQVKIGGYTPKHRKMVQVPTKFTGFGATKTTVGSFLNRKMSQEFSATQKDSLSSPSFY